MSTIIEERRARGLYWDRAWRLVDGCTPVSPGCDHCWAARESAARCQHPNQKVREQYDCLTGTDGAFTGETRTLPGNLLKPFEVKDPRTWAIWNDLFHAPVQLSFIDEVLTVIRRCPQHTFIALTKRADEALLALYGNELPHNLILGFTAENQEWFDRRWDDMKHLPASTTIMVSHEPALGPITYPADFLARGKRVWIVTGGESGAGARPMHPEWAFYDRDQAVAAGVPFYFKQYGEYISAGHPEFGRLPAAPLVWMRSDGTLYDPEHVPQNEDSDVLTMKRVGKARAGRALAGCTYDGMPEVIR